MEIEKQEVEQIDNVEVKIKKVEFIEPQYKQEVEKVKQYIDNYYKSIIKKT